MFSPVRRKNENWAESVYLCSDAGVPRRRLVDDREILGAARRPVTSAVAAVGAAESECRTAVERSASASASAFEFPVAREDDGDDAADADREPPASSTANSLLARRGVRKAKNVRPRPLQPVIRKTISL